MDLTLRPYPTVNQDWLDKNEDAITDAIWEEAGTEFTSQDIRNFVSGTEEQEADFLRAYELRSNHMCYKYECANHKIYMKIPEMFKYNLKSKDIWNIKITEETIEHFNQAIHSTSYDVAWDLADLWYEILEIKPCWAHETIKEDWAKLDPPKEIWWDENPVTDTETRILYQRLSESRYFNDNGLWDRIENKGHTLEASSNLSYAVEYQPNGEHYYGDEYDYDEDGIPINYPYGLGGYLEYTLNP